MKLLTYIRNHKFTFLLSLIALCSFTLYLRSPTPRSAPLLETPNVLILLVDDWGWGDLHINMEGLPCSSGARAPGKPPVRSSGTPHMDELARSGMRFTDFHAASSVCTPSRAALLTGRMGLRTGMNS